MRTAYMVALLIGFQLSTPVERLIAARTQAYDATFRNDAPALRAAVAELEKLSGDSAVGRLALYYAAWTEWSLSMSEMPAGRGRDAIAAAERSVAHSGKPSSKMRAILKFSRCW